MAVGSRTCGSSCVGCGTEASRMVATRCSMPIERHAHTRTCAAGRRQHCKVQASARGGHTRRRLALVARLHIGSRDKSLSLKCFVTASKRKHYGACLNLNPGQEHSDAALRILNLTMGYPPATRTKATHRHNDNTTSSSTKTRRTIERALSNKNTILSLVSAYGDFPVAAVGSGPHPPPLNQQSSGTLTP